MSTDFKLVMSERTDEELVRIVTLQRGEYQPEAVEAAEEEIKIRGISMAALEDIKQSLDAKQEKQKLVDAGMAKASLRFVNFIIDSLVITLVFLILLYILSLIYPERSDRLNQFLLYLSLFAAFFGYYAGMETGFQKTLGKFITKTRVVKSDGGKAPAADIIARTFCRLIPFDRVTYLFSLTGIHDRLSDTIVIMDAE